MKKISLGIVLLIIALACKAETNQDLDFCAMSATLATYMQKEAQQGNVEFQGTNTYRNMSGQNSDGKLLVDMLIPYLGIMSRKFTPDQSGWIMGYHCQVGLTNGVEGDDVNDFRKVIPQISRICGLIYEPNEFMSCLRDLNSKS